MCPALLVVLYQLVKKKPNGEGKRKPDVKPGSLEQNQPVFGSEFNLGKSRYDLVFNGGGESLRCVKTPPIKRLRLNKV